ncbi:A24 family peptidase [Legionella sp. W05-934-2]|jgi:leader peptidase (prepilin peptidase)/N-methyltransferase|uniref:prepilin peptidase n=1 Tax=Legionella sp. W05-934-2 TaxID=1198649 RepID=UPI0034623D79
MFHLPPMYFYIFTVLFALCIGSFLNVVIARLPQMILSEWRIDCRTLLALPEKEETKINLVSPRSHCPHCQTLIPFWHNIPILSFILLRGRCRQCKEKISWRYPIVEATTALLALLCAIHFGQTAAFLFSLLFLFYAITIFFIDLDHQLIPDSLSLSLLWIGLLANTQSLFIDVNTAIYSAIGAYLFLWLFIQLFYWVTGKIGMGNGDFKLYAAFGAWMGWKALPLILLLSSLIGAIVGMIYLRMSQQSKDTPIPFGPFLIASGFIALLYSPTIIQWYLAFYP